MVEGLQAAVEEPRECGVRKEARLGVWGTERRVELQEQEGQEENDPLGGAAEASTRENEARVEQSGRWC